MKAPDRIYVDESRITKLGGLADAIVPDNRVEASNVCYVRKDALLEWAKEMHADLTKKLEAQDDPVWWGQRNAFQQVIDKLNSM